MVRVQSGGDSWESSNPAVATIDSDGKVSALSQGETVIKGRRGGVEATCKVSVRSTGIAATGVSLDKHQVTLRGLDSTAQLQATLRPRDATVSVYWVSDNVNAVQVDREGNLTLVGEGKAVITASASGYQDKCEVTVSVKKVPQVITSQPENHLNQAHGSAVTFHIEAKKGAEMELPGALSYAWYWAKNSTDAGGLLAEGSSDVYSISNFVDVEKDAWYTRAVTFVYQRGLFTGVDGKHFQPDATTSRAALVTVLSRLVTEQERDTAPTVIFTDVPSAAWYGKALAWGISAGVVQGVGAECFAPDAPVTREQLVTILWRYVGSPKTAGSIAKHLDADKVGDYASEAMRWDTENHIIFGNELGYLTPRGQATRAEVSAILTRFLGGDA